MTKFTFPPLPTIGQIIKMYGLSAKQKLAQNFILDFNLIDRVCRAAGNLENATVIEVGAGPGSLTRGLLQQGAKVIAVEKDVRFLPALELLQQASNGKLTIVHGDMLKVDEEQLLKGEPKLGWTEKSNVKIVGNLPFNVGTALMLKWLRMIPERKGPFVYGRVPMVLMFQAELAERIIAKPHTPEYGRLSIIAGQTCNAKIAFKIPGKAFVPPPKVDAGVVYLEPKINLLDDTPLDIVEYVCRQLFSQRRKMLSNSIKTLGEGCEEIFTTTEIDPRVRPQNLTVKQWCTLARAYQDWLKAHPKELAKFQSEMRAKGDSRDMLAMAQRLLDDADSESKIENSTPKG
eukprot:Phypoly_transcript_10361.p1 GENE.Phypoly_transcript_10361~~Phypoly_transcript_10361.p1  ORF type:complete len:345 (+),score=29.13 Phypoly_transcript_10361:102-1136(+)